MRNAIVLAGFALGFGACVFVGESEAGGENGLKADKHTNGGYVLVWADEFNTDGKPDTRNWIYENGFVRNNELQWYQQDNARCENGVLVTIELNKTINKSSDKANPFHEPHFILLNLAIGGKAGGDPSKTKFPSRFEVDYVRVYQKQDRKL